MLDFSIKIRNLQTFHCIVMDIKAILLVLTGIFVVATLFFGTRNGFYDSDDYHGNGSAH